MFQGCTRYAVKLDFIAGLLAKALRCTGGDEARSNQVLLGEVIAWRHLFWSLSNAMANNPTPWRGDAVLPELRAAVSYRVFAPDSYPRIKDIVQRTVTSALIYLPSSVKDLASPETEPYLRQYVRGSHGIGHQERIKIMKLLWDAVGTDRRPARALRAQLLRRLGGYPGAGADRRATRRRSGGDGGAGGPMPLRLRRVRLDRSELAGRRLRSAPSRACPKASQPGSGARGGWHNAPDFRYRRPQ
ncbi:4-hydroxyphenylacetate 3-hydroxylase C-terminal domain-containing protein [Siccirubricoccus deserti]